MELVFATNKDLLKETSLNNFRIDLYYRISGAVKLLPSRLTVIASGVPGTVNVPVLRAVATSSRETEAACILPV